MARTIRAARPEAVAREVIETRGQLKPPRVEDIALKHGYNPTSARNGTPQSTKAYREVMERNAAKVASSLALARAAAVKELPKKMEKARYRDLIYGVDVLTKNERLIAGASTENIAVKNVVIMLPPSEDGYTEPK